MSVEGLTFDQLLGAVVVILILIGAYNSIMTAIKNHREERRHQASPVTELKERVDRHDELLQKDKDRLDDHDKQLHSMGEESRIMLRGVRALLSHEINGNSTDRLQKSATEIDDYLLSRK